MKINSLTNTHTQIVTPAAVTNYYMSNRADEKMSSTDVLELSDKGKKLLEDKEFYATSGKDILSVSKSKGEDSYTVSFEHSAFVERAVARGYITVNDKTIKLSDEDKKKLLKAGKEAETKSEEAFLKRHLEHNMRVAEQQSAVFELDARDNAELIKLQVKLSKGGKLSPAELKKLLEKDPQGYQVAMMIRNMNSNKKPDKNQKVEVAAKEDNYMKELLKTATTEVSDKDIEWKYYDTTLNISFDGGEPVVQAVGIEERYINKPN